MRKLIKYALFVLAILYVALCGGFYFFQEKLLFHPEKLSVDYKFRFKHSFEEVNIRADDSILINGLLFKVDKPKGLIFYLHGNAGALNGWGTIAELYTDLNYDFYILDYRGFGKSGGAINGQEQLFADIQLTYDEMKKRYDEKDIVIMGYSIGTGLATQLASKNNSRLLVLHAPYYSMQRVIKEYCPILPSFLIRYKLETYKYIAQCKMPVIIYHGKEDELLKYDNSEELLQVMDSNKDQLITLAGQKHNGITNNSQYRNDIRFLLDNSR